MAETKFKGQPVRTSGNLPTIHTKAPDFRLIDKDLKEHTLHEFHGKKKLLCTVPSLDTGVCSTMTKHINEFAKKHPNFVFITVSADLPFAQKRFCEHEGVHNVVTLSMMRDKEFGKAYGLLLIDGPLAGLLARSVLVLDEKDHVNYLELVPEITQEPNYHKAFEVIQGHR
ncbi:MAG: thiol peroxidase [Parachlamydiales bacterium]|nr:thiol peroxidase [Parachlamydiales bacterium]